MSMYRAKLRSAGPNVLTHAQAPAFRYENEYSVLLAISKTQPIKYRTSGHEKPFTSSKEKTFKTFTNTI